MIKIESIQIELNKRYITKELGGHEVIMKRRKKNNKLFYMIGILVIIVLVVVLIVNNINNNNNNNTIDNTGVVKTEEDKNVVGVGEYTRTLEDGTKLNTSEALNQDKDFDGFKLYNVQLVSRNVTTTLVADIENNTETDYNDGIQANVTFLTDTQFEIITVPTEIPPLKKGETTQLNVNVSFDYSSAYDFKMSFGN